MQKIEMKEFVKDFVETWLDELIVRGRAFPDTRDGLKDSTRSIITALARRSNFKRTPIPASQVVSDVPTYKDAGEKNIEKNLFRLASSTTPLLNVVSKDSRGAKGLNRITGNYSMPRYVALSLSPLGEYAFKYRDYFTSHMSDVDAQIQKFDYLKTPIPLSLLIPQVNLSDGFSNKAPNLNLHEVIDAYLEHLEKDKKTTTEDLAKHIKGFELTPGTKILMTNQALYDLIERGVCKAVTIAPVTFHKGEMLIKELPFRYFGNTIRNEFNRLTKMSPDDGGFASFRITGYSPEKSADSMMTLNYEINRGFTIKDVKHEIYNKTSLKEKLVYENLCVDFDLDKPLTIKSIREVLDYHVDLGISLKTQEVKDAVLLLEESRDEAELLEKITRKICIDIIGRIIGEPNREELADKYLNGIYEIMKERILVGETESQLKDNPHIDDVIVKSTERLKALTVKQFGKIDEESFMKILNREVPESFTKKQLGKIFLREYQVLYDLNKRNKAIKILTTYKEKAARLEEASQLENIKKSLTDELLDLKSKYKEGRLSPVVYAVKEQEREERKRMKKYALAQIRRMEGKMPVNVMVDSDMKAYTTIDPAKQIPNLKSLYQVTTEDYLVILNREGQSYKVPVRDISPEGTQLGKSDDILTVTLNDLNNSLYIFVTNKGRVVICSKFMLSFRGKKLDIPLDTDESIVFHQVIPASLYSNKISLLLKTADNLIKKKPLTEFKVKDKMTEFFNVFAGNSSTDIVNDALIAPTDSSSLELWGDGYDRVFYYNAMKRNVSFGERLNYSKDNSVFISDKLPHINGRIITDLNALLPEDGYSGLREIFGPLNHEELNKVFQEGGELAIKHPSQIQWIPTLTSTDRRTLSLDFVPDEIQTSYMLKQLGKKEDRQQSM